MRYDLGYPSSLTPDKEGWLLYGILIAVTLLRKGVDRLVCETVGQPQVPWSPLLRTRASGGANLQLH